MRNETDSFENDSNDVMALLDEGEVLFLLRIARK